MTGKGELLAALGVRASYAHNAFTHNDADFLKLINFPASAVRDG